MPFSVFDGEGGRENSSKNTQSRATLKQSKPRGPVKPGTWACRHGTLCILNMKLSPKRLWCNLEVYPKRTWAVWSALRALSDRLMFQKFSPTGQKLWTHQQVVRSSFPYGWLALQIPQKSSWNLKQSEARYCIYGAVCGHVPFPGGVRTANIWRWGILSFVLCSGGSAPLHWFPWAFWVIQCKLPHI